MEAKLCRQVKIIKNFVNIHFTKEEILAPITQIPQVKK